MGARRFTELVAWQLSDALLDEVMAFTSPPPVSRDFSFCNQIRRSADSACANTAEGFGRFRPKEFARFLEIAKGSLEETQDRLHSAQRRGYLNETESGRLMLLARRAIIANTRLQNYLRDRGRNGPCAVNEPGEPREP